MAPPACGGATRPVTPGLRPTADLPPSGEQHADDEHHVQPIQVAAAALALRCGAVTVSEADALAELLPAGRRREGIGGDRIGVSCPPSRS